jgi:hypothetical protein
LVRELLNGDGLFMIVSDHKRSKHATSSVAVAPKLDCVWKTRAYPVPTPSRRGFRWKASALRTLQPLITRTTIRKPVTVVVPALYSVLPAETVAMGWLNEIDALGAIHQRLNSAAKITGWDVFTFHTLHNLDPYFNTTIAAVRDTWLKEGSLSIQSVLETKRQFSKPYDYHRIPARLVENLVFQSSLLDWITKHSSEVPLRLHVIGTALVSALVSTRAVTFEAAVNSVLKFGKRWDDTIVGFSEGRTAHEIGSSRFEQVGKLINGHSSLALGVAREDMPATNAPRKPFWYSPTANDAPVLISTAHDAALALETLNLSSWSCALPDADGEPIRGWLVSPLHPVARACRWSVSNYLLATPDTSTLFLDHIASLGRTPLIHMTTEAVQNRFRLSRAKVTGP